MSKQNTPTAMSIIARQITILSEINENLHKDISDPEQVRKNAETMLRLMYTPLRDNLAAELEAELIRLGVSEN